MSQSTIRSVQQDVMQELKFFIAGATQKIKPSQLELTKTAVSLLKTVPACKEAILEYFCTVFDNATNNYVEKTKAEISSGKVASLIDDDEAVLAEIHTTVCGLVSSRAESWAPIISTWSLNLLGELSTKYSEKAHISFSVNETLQYWMSCRATRTLIDITTQCLSSLINSDTETCINALLDTSVKHSPNFDWVVAHVGSCFPTTVITRVLTCGLKDFCQNKSYEQGCDSPKLKSVVGILGHLAGSHNNDICNALLDLFNASLNNTELKEEDKLQQKATVPYLLQLAFLSPTLLNTVCREIKRILTLDVIVKLYYFIDDWCKYFGSAEALKMFLVNLIMKTEVGGIQIVNILMECVFSDDFPTGDHTAKDSIRVTGREILDYILLELDTQVRMQSQQNSEPIHLLESFQKEIDVIREMILSTEKLKAQTATTLITFIGHNNPSVLVKSAAYLFVNAKLPYHSSLLLQMVLSELLDKGREPYAEQGGHFAAVLEQVFNNYLEKSSACDEEIIVNIWRNVSFLLRWEKDDKDTLLKCRLVSRAILSNIKAITKLFVNDHTPTDASHVIAEILNFLEIPSPKGYVPLFISSEAVFTLTNNVVNYFFLCCREPDFTKKMKGFKKSCNILTRLSLYLKAAKMMALRNLLERSLFSSDKILFGGKVKVMVQSNDAEKLLLEQNRTNRKLISISKNSSVLNGGIIGNGTKHITMPEEPLPRDSIVENTEELIRAIKACCAPIEENIQLDVSLESLTSVSLLLVQLISPDVMYNGLPWPEEEFCKVTIERDFYIRRLFNKNPLLWDLLSLVAIYRPTLCYCSVLLRALTATLIHQWNSMGDVAESDKYKTYLDTTIRLLDVMSLGQLLPPPLSEIRNVVVFLKPFEIVVILRECVWNYMRDHVPSPALYNIEASGIHWRDPLLSRPPDTYTKTLRIIMAHNIKNVASLYHSMFVNIPKPD